MDLLQNLVFLREKGEEPHLHCGQTKYNQQNGSLYLTNKRVLWVPSGSTTPTLNVPLSIILGHFVSPATHKKALLKISINLKGSKEDHVFEFTSQHAVQERDGFKQFLAKLLPKQKADAGSDSSPATPATPGTPGSQRASQTPTVPRMLPPPRPAEISIQETKQRAALLASNPDLQLCYAQLVDSGIITSSEFWASRQHLIDAELSKQSAQQRGMPTALITEVRPSEETLNGEIKYRLTPDIIRQIFLEYPGVKQVYDDNVPHKLSEKEFWRKYFQSQYFHRDRLAGTTINVAERDIFDRCAEEDERVYAPPVKRPRGIDPTVDVSGEGELPEGYGDAENLRQPKHKSLSLIRRYNRHAAIVIGAHPSGAANEAESMQVTAAEKSKEGRVSEAVRLPDLEMNAAQDVAQLRIKDPRLYFEGHSQHVAEKVDSTTPSELLTEFRKGLEKPIAKRSIEAAATEAVMRELKYLEPKRTKDVAGSKSEDLDEQVKTTLMEHFLTVNELLRHFWSTHKQPVISPESRLKLERVTRTLQTRKTEIEAFLHAQSSTRAKASFKPLTESMDHALKAGERYLLAT